MSLTPKQCKCGASHWMHIEYHWTSPEHYDGISEVQCVECKTRYGRWTKNELGDKEIEKRYGGLR